MRRRCSGIASIRAAERRREQGKRAYWGAMLDAAERQIEQERSGMTDDERLIAGGLNPDWQRYNLEALS